MRKLLVSLLLSATLITLLSEDDMFGTVPPVWPGPSHDPVSLPGQYVFLTPKGDALVIYPPQRRGAREPFVTVPLLNQARPKVGVELSRLRDGRFEYLYTVANGAGAGNAIGTFALVGYPGDTRLEMYHSHPEGDEDKRWRGGPPQQHYTLIARQVKLHGAPTGAYLRWMYHVVPDLIEPGESMGGFSMKSAFRPGFTTGFVATLSAWDLEPEWGDEVFSQLRFLNRTEWKDQPLLTIGPRYTDETSREVIVRDFLTGIEEWIRDGNLAADSPLVQRLVIGLRALAGGPQDSRRPVPQPASNYERVLLDAVRFTLEYEIGGEG